MSWKFWQRRPKADEDLAQPRSDALLETYLSRCVMYLEDHREDFIASPSKRMVVVAVFYRDWGFVHQDVTSILDEFAQIQMKRGLEDHDRQRNEHICTVVNNYVVGHRPEDLEGDRGLGSAAGGVPEGGGGDHEGSGDVTGA